MASEEQDASPPEKSRNETIVETWLAVTFRPARFFSQPIEAGKRWRPLGFAAIIVAIVATVGWAVQQALPSAWGGGVGPGLLGAVVIAQIGLIVSVYFNTACAHVALRLAGVRGSFKDTFAVVGYSYGPTLFGVVPILGTIVGLIWQLVVIAIGLRHARRTTMGRAAFATILAAALPILLALGLRARVMEAFKISSGAMAPSAISGDHFFVSKSAYGIEVPGMKERLFARPPGRGDVIVFRYPEKRNEDFVKRAIAMPSDTLEAINGRPVISGWLVPHCHVGRFEDAGHPFELYVERLGERSYLTMFEEDPDAITCAHGEPCDAGSTCRAGICGRLEGPFKVAPGEVWVMGDNRNNSFDSRMWNKGRGGGVPFEDVKGRAMFVWMSFGPNGSINNDRLFHSLHAEPALPHAGSA
jgi:signal peptidase I